MSTLVSAALDRAYEAAQLSRCCVFASSSETAKAAVVPGSVVHRIVLGAQPEPGCEALDSYLREDWEYRLIASFDTAARTWHKRNGGERLFALDGLDFADYGRFSFLTRVILEKGRTLAAISDALDALAPTEVYCDDALAPYLRVLHNGPLHVVDAAANARTAIGPENNSPEFSARSSVGELLLGLGYKLVYAIGLSRWLQLRQGDSLANSEPVFIGSEHGLKNLEPFFSAVNRRINVLRPVGQFRRNRGLANSKIDWRVTYLESLLSVSDSLRVASRSLQVARWFWQTLRTGGFVDLLEWKERDCLSLFLPEFARFVLAHSVGAFRNHYIAQMLIDQHRPARVFFDNANAWEFSVMVEQLRRAEIPTTGFVNGLVQDIIPFRCAVDTLLTSGRWDQRLLQPTMTGSEVVAYGNPSGAPAMAERKNLLIISSSCRDRANRKVFARAVAEYIDSTVAEHEFDEIVVKLHPYEDPEAMRHYFAEFPKAAARLRITRTNLEQELSHARLAICLLSTVIRDLAWDGTPFLLFDSAEWPTHTFYSQIPERVKFTSAAELATKAADLDALRAESLRIRNFYFGEPSPDAIPILRSQLLGEND